MATSAIMWHDEKNQTAEFEPVGTHPNFRRQHLGRALLIHGMHKARAAGVTRMLVACSSSPKNPAAKALYYSVGFREFSRDLPHRQPQANQGSESIGVWGRNRLIAPPDADPMRAAAPPAETADRSDRIRSRFSPPDYAPYDAGDDRAGPPGGNNGHQQPDTRTDQRRTGKGRPAHDHGRSRSAGITGGAS
jgi:hypothetical protein